MTFTSISSPLNRVNFACLKQYFEAKILALKTIKFTAEHNIFINNRQGIITEGEGTVQVTSLYQQVQIGYLKLEILFFSFTIQAILIRR
jgi:hypothetical protein